MKAQIPKRITTDKYKGDTEVGKFQLVIVDDDTHEPIDILPNRRKDTIKEYLYRCGSQVELVVRDINPSFKAAVYQALGQPIIVADCFPSAVIFIGRLRKYVEKYKRIGMHMTERNGSECDMCYIKEVLI